MGKKEWRLLIKKGLVFILLFVVMDLTLGYTTKFLFRIPNSGKFAHITHVMEEAEDDLFIFGDSHARRHYVPDVLSEKLGYSVYNAGVRGQHLVFHYAMQEVMLARHQPKVIILDLNENWLYPSDRNNQRLADLHPYYWDHRPQLKPILEHVDSYLDAKLAIRTYQQNSSIIHILSYLIIPQKSQNGYLPLRGTMKPNEQMNPDVVESFQETLFSKGKLDPFYEESFLQFMDNCTDKKITVIGVISPTLSGDSLEGPSINQMKSMLQSRDIPLLDFSGDDQFAKKFHLFNDFNHLNHEGATLFSNKLVERINEQLEDEESGLSLEK